VLVAGWEIILQATVGASPSRHGKTLRDIPFFRVRAHALINPFPLKAYTFDPLANLTSEQASLVLGGQHLLWTEPSGLENLDSSGRAQPHPRRCSGRVPGETIVRRCRGCTSSVYRFRRRGVNAISLQPEWGALRPFACDLNA
jgi:hypothetical protein